jgi:cytochrome c2/cytochrome c5
MSNGMTVQRGTIVNWRSTIPIALVLTCFAWSAEAADADHPVVAGFERFFAKPEANQVRGGELLLGELNCTSCHQPGDKTDGIILKKQAPILDKVGTRARPEWLRAYLSNPQATKPGTTMPNLFAALPEKERNENVEALVHFLASTGAISESATSAASIERGKIQFHQLGCVSCHAPVEKTPGENQEPAPELATSIPLGNATAKYSIPSLSAFISDPHAVRPSGRMPSLNLTAKEASEVANYLLRDLKLTIKPNLAYRYYEGEFTKLPDFDKLTPKTTGEVSGFDLGIIKREDNLAVLYEGFLRIDRDGDYTFWTTSGDGSRIWIDGNLVVDNDGIHPPQTASGNVKLTKGIHRFRTAVFDGNGGQELAVEYEGPELGRRAVSNDLYLKEDGPALEAAENERSQFRPEASQIEKGRTLFGSLGCASCHQLKEGDKTIESTFKAADLASIKGNGGCLDEAPAKGVPSYALNAFQRADLKAAVQSLANPSKPQTQEDVVGRTLTALNCYACHKRGELGGVEEGRNAYFETTQKEMGDEGRVPPTLSGIGAKLTSDWLKQVLNDGAKDRPYMLTRMPRFGGENVGHLASAFESTDPIKPLPAVEFEGLTPRKVKATGRHLVGSEAFGCIKCHNFRGIESTGLRSIDMSVMTRRVRREWFAAYLADPQAYRPGTRMPSYFPEGQSTLPSVLAGNPARQTEAVWQYLSEGGSAAIPYGLGRDPIPLVAENEAIIYRAFIEGAGPRGIGVGLPEKLNLAFDANDLRVAMIWQGGFIDASRHWVGRGEGFQPPLGDNILPLPTGPSLARLESLTVAWPKSPARENGYKFLGYRLSKEGRKPTFRYEFGPIRVEDSFSATPGKDASRVGETLVRTFTIQANEGIENLYLRAAVADKIEAKADGWYSIGDDLKVRIIGDLKPMTRQIDGKTELLVPVRLDGKPVTFSQEYQW